MLAYYVVKFFSWIMCVAPKCLRNLTAAILGGIAVVATPKWRMQMAAANIQECLGVDKARAQQIAEKSLRRFGRMVVEVMRFPLLNKDNITKLVNVEGLEYLEEAYKQNKGVIIATGHFGNWELLGALKEKKLLGVLYDQDTNDDGVDLKLFGKDSIIPLGAAALSRIYGSPVLPCFIHNSEEGGCTVKIYPPLYTPKSKDREKDFYDVTQELVVILEHEIISHPEMWFWVHDRWKDGRERFAVRK